MVYWNQVYTKPYIYCHAPLHRQITKQWHYILHDSSWRRCQYGRSDVLPSAIVFAFTDQSTSYWYIIHGYTCWTTLQIENILQINHKPSWNRQLKSQNTGARGTDREQTNCVNGFYCFQWKPNNKFIEKFIFPIELLSNLFLNDSAIRIWIL